MLVTVKGKNVEVTDALRRYAEKKVQKLEKYFRDIKEAQVTQSVQRNWHIVEVQLEGDGVLIRGEERSDDMYASIDLVVEKLERRVQKFKGKLYGKSTEKGPKEKEAQREQMVAEAVGVESLAEVPAEEEESPRIVRTKRFALKPMSPEEAANQMELLHHDFFVFLNDDTQSFNVVYRRKDGNYGLIEPEL
ncbi:MAG TPA: ribosome-associated translation inhibitor RaiA [Armatimonadota bacterium]|nr:ribosome-associated translation inhibitor RaiA [Armatimonadota bacterium]HOP80110.1 ribosome-associated translation inhibitor RaiA [Armatimonadota bacterium]